MNNKFDLMKKLVPIYQNLASAPIPVEARVLKETNVDPNVKQIVVKWSQRNLERNERIAVETLYQITKQDSEAILVQTLSTKDVTQELYSKYSPSEQRKCVIRLVPDGSIKKQFLEIWEDGVLSKTVDLKALDLHGDICPPGEFGSVEWSVDNTTIAYIAEKKRIKPEPFFSSKPQVRPGNDEEFPYGEEYTYIEDWGEQLTDLSQTVIVVYNLTTGFEVLDVIPEGWCPGQLLWDQTGRGFYGIAYKNTSPRLGMIYCTNRESHIFHYPLLNGSADFNLTGPGLNTRSLRLSPDWKTLVWLQRPSNGPHDSCNALMKMDTDTKVIQELVPIIETEVETIHGPKFTGLYMALPQRCFTMNSTWIFLSTICDNECREYTVSKDGSLTDQGQGQVLDIWENDIVGIRGTPSTFPYLYMYLNGASSPNTILTPPVTAVEDVEVTTQILNFPVPGVDIDNFNIIFLKPSSASNKLPLIVFLHGGPHSVNHTTFMLEPAFFAKCGFAVLLVNYRGSLGSGQKGVDSLLGKIGALDVGDVQHALEHILSQNADIDEQLVAIYGGSHGGYLALQLAAQHPSSYKSVVVRNPVVDLPTMFATSDIPDWVSTEIGSTYNPQNKPTLGENSLMIEMSPISWIDSYKAPTLFLLGKNDRRVPLAQSLYYNRLLKARGIKTKVHIYPDNHALETVPVHLDALINATFWIYESLGIA